ncbi:DUF3466 family protein [Colwellia sp. TT2012]|uniref:DUF3466 family protein n=1 Tax=Colwellia sp. TT2012 TaxID=1720342 RepID=UPI00070900A3|nr:DUF3466 family protein [Colwellia sp. TT2012]
MKQYSKNILVLAVASVLSLSALSNSQAAIYEVVEVDKNAEAYTDGGKLNINGEMAISGSNSYNFPVQFDYLDDNDFNDIVYLALTRHDYYFGLEVIEDLDAMKAGEPTANDLAWAKMYLQERNTSTTNPNFEYQFVADAAAMINLDSADENISSIEICIFDTGFDGTPCADVVTRSTVNVIQGITDSGFIFGTGSAPYLPIEGPATESDGTFKTHWVREHGQRAFYIDTTGEIIAVEPDTTEYGGGISALFDMNDNGIAVGYTSYKLSDARVEYINDTSGGCADPSVLAIIPEEICIQKIQSGMYYIQAFKATISATGKPETEQLGLLITPHADDERAFSSQALAINNHDIAVGYAHGWDDSDVVTPASNERMTGSYAVLYKDGKVLDFNQKHYYFTYGNTYPFSRAYDINDNGLVVGYTRDPDTFVKKLFYVDTNVAENEMEIIIPKDFFTTSVSTAFSVNSAGVIVGEGQIETHNDSSQNPRRTAGFIYDTASDSPVLIDVNTLLACNSKYNILKASDINDAGQISATAIVKSKSYDAKGVAILDDSGNPVMIDVARAVLLNPIAGGEVEDCGLFEDKVERQGASFGGMVLFSLLAVFGLRRRKFNS